MANILPKGTQIQCPRKRHLIGVTNTDLQEGEAVRVKIVDFEPMQARIAGEPMKCKICDSAYFVQNKLYTSAGWCPTDPTLEPVSR